MAGIEDFLLAFAKEVYGEAQPPGSGSAGSDARGGDAPRSNGAGGTAA